MTLLHAGRRGQVAKTTHQPPGSRVDIHSHRIRRPRERVHEERPGARDGAGSGQHVPQIERLEEPARLAAAFLHALLDLAYQRRRVEPLQREDLLVHALDDERLRLLCRQPQQLHIREYRRHRVPHSLHFTTGSVQLTTHRLRFATAHPDLHRRDEPRPRCEKRRPHLHRPLYVEQAGIRRVRE